MILLITMATAAVVDVVEKQQQHPNQFTQEDVANFLRATFGDGERGMKLLKTFQENDIDGSLLMDLNEDDLTHDLGMTKLQARKFKSSLAKVLSVVYDNNK